MLFISKSICTKYTYHCGGNEIEPFYRKGIRNPCCFGHLLSCLHVAKDLLDKFQCRYWLDCATLLGQFRHGGLLPWDLDIDFSIFEEYAPLFLAKTAELQKKGFWICYRNISDPPNTIRTDPNDFSGRLAVFKIQAGLLNKMHVDIYTCKKKDDVVIRANQAWPAPQFPYELVDDLEQINFHGFEINRPRNSERYLKFMYGDNFNKIPDHRIDDMKYFQTNFNKYKKVLNINEDQYRFWP